MLTVEQAVEIYKLKLSLQEDGISAGPQDAWKLILRGKSATMSKFYGVSPRAIRDIWNRKTWGYATAHLWTQEQGDTPGAQMSGCSSLQVCVMTPNLCSFEYVVQIGNKSYLIIIIDISCWLGFQLYSRRLCTVLIERSSIIVWKVWK